MHAELAAMHMCDAEPEGGRLIIDFNCINISDKLSSHVPKEIGKLNSY